MDYQAHLEALQQLAEILREACPGLTAEAGATYVEILKLCLILEDRLAK
jgi:hypothetical protein